MIVESLNRAAFSAVNLSAASPGAIASLEALAIMPIWLLPPLLAGIWLLGRRDDRAAATWAGLASCVGLVVAHLASLAIDHPRPFAVGLAPNVLDHVSDSSFPSDHAAVFFALAFAFAGRPVSGLPGLAWVLATAGLVVGSARVALGVHFPLDVLGSLAIGGVAVVVSDLVLRKPGAALFGVGERLRGLVVFLTRRYGRQAGGATDARPAR